jgi:hypothetical protein
MGQVWLEHLTNITPGSVFGEQINLTNFEWRKSKETHHGTREAEVKTPFDRISVVCIDSV